MLTLWILLIFVAVVWLGLSGQVWRLQRSIPRLQVPQKLTAHKPEALVSVVVPARNEGGNIEACLRSLIAQRGVELEVIAINDGSDDDTGEVMDRLAASDPRLRVLHNPTLPEGWLGKTNAMHQGAALAQGEYLLFTDADIVHHPDGVATALAAMQQQNASFLTLAPVYRWQTFFENTWVPAFMLVLLSFGSTRYNDPEARDDAVGIGAFILLRRSVYLDLGGHQEIKGSVVDDADLGKLVKRAGNAIAVFFAPDLLQVRMYQGNAQAFWGLTKNILGTMEGQPLKAIPVAAGLSLVFGLGPVSAVLGLLWGQIGLAIAGFGLYASQYASLFLLRSWHDFNPLKLLGFPLFLAMFWACVLKALYFQKIKGTVLWRGREVKI